MLAPVAPPSGLALLGTEGRDAYGYPTQYVNQAGLRSLLAHRRFADLTTNVEAFQARFEADNRHEYWLVQVGDAFNTAEPQLLSLMNEWVAASPRSFAPYFARAAYWHAVADSRRGVNWAAYTTPEQFEGMRDADAHAQEDLARALELRRKLVAAHNERLAALFGADEAERHRTLDAALRICPRCFQIRATYIRGLGGGFTVIQFRRFA